MEIIIGLILSPVLTIIHGLLLKLFWGWFVVPLGVPAIGVAHALGISLVVSMLTHQRINNNDNDSSIRQEIFVSIATAIILLVFGATFHAFM